jgi:hypothetical protein
VTLLRRKKRAQELEWGVDDLIQLEAVNAGR